jgi:DNA-binding CsgD family transcriptional regulator
MSIRRIRQHEGLAGAQLRLIDAIYGAVADSTRWPEVVAATTDLVGGGASAVLLRSYRTGEQRFLASDLDRSYAATYEQHYASVSPWVLRTTFDRPQIQFNDEMLPSPEEMDRSEFWSDWLRPQDIRYTFNASVRVGPEHAVELAAIRVRRLGPIDELERDAVHRVYPHLQRAVELSRRLMLAEAGRTASTAATRKLGSGLLLVDSRRHVAFADPEADSILTGGGLTVRGGLLRAPAGWDERLGVAVARATGQGRIIAGRSGALLTIPRSGERPPLSVAVGPLDERDLPIGLVGPLAMVLVTDPERSGGPSEEGLRALFDLTPAEAKLVVALCSGETLSSYADATDTTVNTVKTHLKRVFDKTGETRQPDLIRRVMNDVALRLREMA